ncbi:MAG: carbohydrate binding domain-containing protein [Planctomycetota bacterium]
MSVCAGLTAWVGSGGGLANAETIPTTPGAWVVESQQAAMIEMTDGVGDEAGSLQIAVTSPGTEDWHAQAFHVRPAGDLTAGEPVTLKFEAKAQPSRGVVFVTQHAAGDYANQGLAEWRGIAEAWTTIELTFTPETGQATRVPSMLLGNQRGKVWLRNMVLTPGEAGGADEGAAAPPPAPDVDAVELLDRPLATDLWRLETHGVAQATMTPEADTLKFAVDEIGAEGWHVQAFRTGLDLVAGQTYTVSFAAKAQPARSVFVAANANGPTSYDGVGLSQTVDIPGDWKTFEMSFVAEADGGSRLPYLLLGHETGDVWIKDLSVKGPPPAAGSMLRPTPLPASWFPFPLPWDDTLAGTATDVSFLNHTPAGKFGPVVVRDGRFVLSDTGERIRFWGINAGGPEVLVADASEYPAYAKRLAKHGINAIRLHHLDNSWAKAEGGSLWKADQVRMEIDPAKLDQLHAFIDAIVAEGIYFNLNLKVSKGLSEADGMPASLARIDFNGHNKRVDRFYPPMIEHQEAYARTLLNSTNAAGVRLADHPALMTVEISNENSLVGWHYEAPGSDLALMPEPFVSELRDQWNAWLAERYEDDGAMAAAWRRPGVEPGLMALDHAATWRSRTHASGRTVDVERTGSADGVIRFEVGGEPGLDWHAQAMLGPLPLEADAAYTVRFDARAEAPLDLRITLDKLPDDPGGNAGHQETVRVGTAWSTQTLTMFPSDVPDAGAALALQLGRAVGGVEVRGLKVFAGVPAVDPGETGTLADGNVRFFPFRSPAMAADFTTFLADTDRAFNQRMKTLLRDELGVTAPLTDTQSAWGGSTAYYREATSDFLDAHEYWHHPQFTGGMWDPANWVIGQASFVGDLHANGRHGVAGTALRRQEGKPFVVSEFDHPAPNEYRSEMAVVGAGFAALQDWDAIFTFAGGFLGETAEASGQIGKINHFFDIAGDPSRFALFPAAAMIFRTGQIAPHPEARVLELPEKPWRFAHGQHAQWSRLEPLRDRSALSARWMVRPDAGVSEPRLVTESAGSLPGGAQVQTRDTSAGPVFTAVGDASVVAAGFFDGAPVQAGPVDLTLRPGPLNHATAALISVDGQPIDRSTRRLLTVASRAENVGMTWNADRTTVRTGWGQGPVHVEPVTGTVRLRSDRPASVFALGPRGERRVEVPAAYEDGEVVFDLTADQATVWWEIVTR